MTISSQAAPALSDRTFCRGSPEKAHESARLFATTHPRVKVAAGLEPVQGEMTDVASMRTVLKGVDTLFLLNAVVPDETTQALGTLDLAREAGIQRIVYFPVFKSALFDDVPHFAGKYFVERVIDAQAIPATVLRPAYFMQNDLMFRMRQRLASIRSPSVAWGSQ